MKKTNYPYIIDFETTVYAGQEKTEVWAAACVQLFTETVKIFHSIDELYSYFKSLKRNVIALTHNLKFDGCFWLDYGLKVLKYKQAYYKDSGGNYHWKDKKYMKSGEILYTISNMGQWYRIIFKTGSNFIEIRDSLKLLPFSVAEIGKAFKTKAQKLEMEYSGKRYSGCTITEAERKYIANDVLVVKEALEQMWEVTGNALTIGSACLKDFKTTLHHSEWARLFPRLDLIDNINNYGAKNADEYIRKSYRGGWCYVAAGKAKKVYRDGVTLDVNSLYPSVMLSESGNKYPIGCPYFYKGESGLKYFYRDDYYCFIRFKCRFYLKDGYLPFVQIKNNPLYKSTEMLTTSDVYEYKTGKFHRWIWEGDKRLDTSVVMTMTEIDWKLFNEHYNLEDLEILDTCVFQSTISEGLESLFDPYILKWRKVKESETGAKRTIAKLYSNNLYGKTATSMNSSFKIAYIKEDGSLGFYTQNEYNQKPVYIPIGSAITSYARNVTIRAAQQNYYGPDKAGFIYADTDSLHLDLPLSKIRGVAIDSKRYGAWKCETEWKIGYFVRQKTYIEMTSPDITQAEWEQLSDSEKKERVSIKCAGLPEKCKNLVGYSILGLKMPAGEYNKLTDKEKEFVNTKREITDYNEGLCVPGKLIPKRIDGGIVLVETDYMIRG